MIRIVRGSPATLSATFYADEALTDLDDVPTVTVTRVDGSEIDSVAATRTGVGTYTYALAPQADLSVLTAVWAGALDGNPASVTTYAEVVGAEYFSIAELRAFDSVLSNTTRYPTDKLKAARLAVEAEFEGICGRAFVPRYALETLISDGNGRLWLSNPDPIRVLSCFVNDDDDWSDRTFTRPVDNLRVVGLSNGESFPRDGRVRIEYEYGMVDVPIRIKHAAMKRAKYSLVADQSRIDERATTMNVPDFGNFVLATPGMRGSYTGIPEVDVVLQDYAIGSL